MAREARFCAAMRLQSEAFSILGFLVVMFLAVVVAPASAATDQSLETLLRENHFGPVRTTVDFLNQQYFVAKINGRDVRFILDTGAERTVINQVCARSLGLAIHDTGKHEAGVGGVGRGTFGVASISSFTINGWPINHPSTICVIPSSQSVTGGDGLFGFDCLHLNSALIGVGSIGFLIRPGALPQTLPLNSHIQSLGFRPVSLAISKNRLLVSGTYGGQPLSAQIDTGAARTFFDLSSLARWKVDTGKSRVFMFGVDRRPMAARQFMPRDLYLGSFHAPRQLMYAVASPLLEYRRTDALIGFDFLSARHAIIDTGSGVLWLR